MNLLGVDIGGTKCAVVYGQDVDGQLTVIDKVKFPTTSPDDTIQNILVALERMMATHGLTPSNTQAVGISCGGPLNSKKGVVMSPPNLPGWDNVPIVQLVEERTGVRAALQNDANACALAEYKYGAGKGTQNMVFLTFGTGLGAGIVINGKLYSGTNDNAGEIGHIRLAPDGPYGYRKHGSFEGFCSGGGIAQIAKKRVQQLYDQGEQVAWCPKEIIPELTTAKVAEAAQAGDSLALEIFHISARKLGFGLSMVIDILNPERIVIGSVYARNVEIMKPEMQRILEEEALSEALSVCEVVPAALGEQVGDFSSLSIAASI